MTVARQAGTEAPGTKRRGTFLRLLAIAALALAGPPRRSLGRKTRGAGPSARSAAGRPLPQAGGGAQRDPAGARAGQGRPTRRRTFRPRGWKDILLRVFHEVSEDRILLVAAGVTFYVILAIFPALAAFVSLYGLFADPATIASHLGLLRTSCPAGALDIITEQVNRLVSQGRSELGLKLALGLAISLWSANAGMKSLFDALNVAYQEEEKRGFLS